MIVKSRNFQQQSITEESPISVLYVPHKAYVE
jgi:hypothetical protein